MAAYARGSSQYHSSLSSLKLATRSCVTLTEAINFSGSSFRTRHRLRYIGSTRFVNNVNPYVMGMCCTSVSWLTDWF